MKDKEYSHKNVFVLPSYIGLPCVLKNFKIKNPENMFLTNNKSLHSWLISLNVNVILTPSFSSDLSRKAIGILKGNNLKLAAEFQDCKIYYFFYLSNIPMLHLIKALSETNHTIYINEDPLIQKIVIWKLRPFKEFKKMFVANLAFGFILNIWPSIYKADTGAIFGKKFRFAEYQKPLKSQGILEENKSIIQTATGLETLDILYIDNITSHYPEAARIVTVILKKLQSTGRTIHVKPHPTFKPIIEVESFSLIPNEIPSEICMQFAQLIIGVSSTSMKEPVDTIVISLLDILPIPSHVKERVKIMLKSNKICFVSSEEQLIDLVNQSKVLNEN